MRAAPRPPPDPRPWRTYVVFGYVDHEYHGLFGGPAARQVTVFGTIRAPSRAVARAAGREIAGRRAPALMARGCTVRVWAAGGCRRAWLLEALAQDGRVLLRPARP